MFPRRRFVWGKVFLAVAAAFATLLPFMTLLDVVRYHHLVVDGVYAPGVITGLSTTGRGKGQTYTANYEFEDQKGQRRSGDERIDRAEYERYSSRKNYPVEVRYVPSARHNSTLDISRRRREAGTSAIYGAGAALIVTILCLYDQSPNFARQRADYYERQAAICRREGWRRAREGSASAAEWVANYQRLEKELRKSQKEQLARMETLLARWKRPAPPRRSVVERA